jgi:hypothetical protein
LKPQTSYYTGYHFLMVLMDACFSCLFILCIAFHIAEDQFATLNDKVIECIVGIGFTGIATLFSFMDGSRFIYSKIDRVLYFVSCLLQKPILLPIIFSNRFRSPVATEGFSEQEIIKVNGQMPQVFVLAVQEINFFHSFTISFFIALTTLCDQLMDNRYDSTSSQVLFFVSAIQWAYGMFTCLYLYGRKVPERDEDLLKLDEDSEEDDTLE